MTPRDLDQAVGKGRMFVSTPGHRVEIVDDPNVRTIIERAMLLAAG